MWRNDTFYHVSVTYLGVLRQALISAAVLSFHALSRGAKKAINYSVLNVPDDVFTDAKKTTLKSVDQVLQALLT